MRRAHLLALAVGLASASSAGAQTAFTPAPELSPGTRYDPKIPTIQQVLGYDHGERITTPDDVPRYLRALAEAAPDRARLTEYARSWQGRPLWLFVIGNPERMARLDEIKASRRAMADPRGASASDIDRLVREQPVITALLHSVHGNEISGVDAALAEAYHLLAAVGDPTVDLIMRESIVLIDPMQNPDGRARFVSSNVHGRAMMPDEDPLSAEHDEGWPGGRTNHYLFDLNRDWFPQNHPESQGKVRFLLEWLPQVTVDLHEMGGESQYYFPPAAAPNTPNTTQAQRDWMVTFGRANAARFDERGFAYFTRDIYDSFYPGYGASWPFFIGSLGKTFEMAGTRGLRYRRSDGTLLTYRDGVVRHFTAAIQTAATAAANREKMLRDFIDYRRSAVTEGGTTEYVLAAGSDPMRTQQLAHLLVKNGLDVRRIDAPAKVGGRDVAAGSFVVPLAQPMGRLVKTLLDPHVSMGDEFIAEQDRRRKLRLPDQIYDITSWSLPLLYDVDLIVSDRPTGAKTTAWPLRAETHVPPRIAPGKVGYLIPWGAGMAAAMAELSSEGFTVRVSGAPFTLGGRQYGIGTAILRNDENAGGLRDRLASIAWRHNLDVVSIDTAWVDAGASLGANSARIVKTPRVLLLWDAPTQSLSAGWARFSLERRFNQPVTIVRGNSFGRANLADYDVIILPAGNYGSVLSGAMLDRVREWMRTGGTLITLGEASRWAASAGLLDTSTELRDGRPDRLAAQGAGATAGEAARATPPDKYDYEAAITPPRERPEATSGVIARVLMNMEHWMSSGTDGEIQAMVEGDRVFKPLTLDRGTNVGVYAEEARLVAGGLVWPEVRKQLARKAFLMHQPVGQGHVIAFAEDPNFRGFTELTQMLMMNAVLFGPVR